MRHERKFILLAFSFCLLATAAHVSRADEEERPFQRLRERIKERRQSREDSAAPDKSSSTGIESLEFGGLTRTYVLHSPPAYAPDKYWPVVIVLHGGSGDAANAERMSDMSAKADKEGFLAVYPNGTGVRDDKFLTWNSWNCCGYAQKNNIDDTGFIRALVMKLERENHADPKKIYVTGLSNGAMLTYKVACDLSDIVAAASPVEGALNGECEPVRAVPMIIFHGTADQNVPYNGGQGKKSLIKCTDEPVSHAVSLWVKNNGCDSTSKRTQTGNIILDAYSGCRDGADVLLYTIKGQGHAWAGGKPGIRNGNVDPPTNEISATDTMWDFFSKHERK